MRQLYGLDPDLALFRYLRFLWNGQEDARPLLALLACWARDPAHPAAYDEVETNILFFDVDPELVEAPQFVQRLRESGVLMLAESPRRIRALTHLDVSADDVHFAGKCLQGLAVEHASAAKRLA